MEMKLNIYRNREIEKTYTAETYDLMFGTVEDIINLIDLDALSNKENSGDFIAAVSNIVVKGFEHFKPLLKDIFVGLTDEELRRVKISEIIPVIMNVIKFTFAQSFQPTKNA